jgi:O-antigen ligase
MSDKSDFVDYEPLNNPRPHKRGEDVGIRQRVSAVSNSAEVSDHREWFDRKLNPGEPQIANSAVSRISEGSAALKRGHFISFIGLYLFTVLVFVRPYELSPWLAWLSRGALVTALVTLLVFIPTQLGLENKLTVRTREVNLLLILLFLCLLSVPFALDKLRAWNAFVEYSKVVVMFVVMVNVVRTEKRLKALLLLILVISVALSLAAINDYRLGNLALGGKRISGVIGGMFENPNDLALHLVTFFPVIIGLAFGSRRIFVKLLYLASAICVLAGTVVTFSRGAFIGLIVVFVTLVWRFITSNRILVVLATGLLVGAFLLLAPGAYRQRIGTTGDESARARTGELKRSLFLAARHPVFGVGMDNFVIFSDTEHATHNSYTQVASEIGLTAAVVYVMFLITPLKSLRRVSNVKQVDKNKRSLPYLAVGIQASLIGYMVVSFFASVAYLWYVYYLVGYSICVSRLYEHLLTKQKIGSGLKVIPAANAPSFGPRT